MPVKIKSQRGGSEWKKERENTSLWHEFPLVCGDIG